LEESALYL